MEIIQERLSTPVVYHCDVLVAGGGFAGISAALAAARAGAQVLLLERGFLLGGLATAGLVTIYLPLCDGHGNQMSFGLSESLLRLSIQNGVEGRNPGAWLSKDVHGVQDTGERFEAQFNPHFFAMDVEQLLVSKGVQILYGTSACAVQREGDRLTHLIMENKSGRSAVAARVYIDATGDADLCHFAGVKTALYQPKNALAAWYYAYTQGDVKLRMHGVADRPAWWMDGEESPSLTKERYQGLEAEEISRMMTIAHAKMLEDIENHRRSEPLYAPVTLPSTPQLRMTRRLVGAYTLDETEDHAVFDDSIGCIGDWRKRGPAFQIPYRTLYSPEIANLMTAGRSISVTDAMWDITRVIPACAVTGEAAGAAATLGDDVRAISLWKLQSHLMEHGVKLSFPWQSDKSLS